MDGKIQELLPITTHQIKLVHLSQNNLLALRIRATLLAYAIISSVDNRSDRVVCCRRHFMSRGALRGHAWKKATRHQ
jgi:hypothetical protein